MIAACAHSTGDVLEADLHDGAVAPADFGILRAVRAQEHARDSARGERLLDRVSKQGLPAKVRIFLCGTDFDPLRVGTMARTSSL